ncbi:MAG: GNAT family N-acetyltransferase [Chloroflexota bacterium]
MNQPVMELTFRPFQIHDQTIVHRLILEGLGDHFSVVDTSLNPDLDDINASYVEKGHAFLVAQSAGQIVGVGALVALDGQVGRLVRISVARGYRRLGIGAMIVNQLVELARERHFKRLVVETNFDWLEAIALYRNCGFQQYDRDEESVHMDLILSHAR